MELNKIAEKLGYPDVIIESVTYNQTIESKIEFIKPLEPIITKVLQNTIDKMEGMEGIAIEYKAINYGFN